MVSGNGAFVVFDGIGAGQAQQLRETMRDEAGVFAFQVHLFGGSEGRRSSRRNSHAAAGDVTSPANPVCLTIACAAATLPNPIMTTAACCPSLFSVAASSENICLQNKHPKSRVNASTMRRLFHRDTRGIAAPSHVTTVCCSRRGSGMNEMGRRTAAAADDCCCCLAAASARCCFSSALARMAACVPPYRILSPKVISSTSLV